MTTLAVVLFQGMNISILGLVFVPKASLYVIAEVLALIVTLALVYAGSMAYVWRGSLGGAAPIAGNRSRRLDTPDADNHS
ncbi:MAG: hypothetical protein ABI681_04105 [Gemmatimonadales bacterium]